MDKSENTVLGENKEFNGKYFIHGAYQGTLQDCLMIP